MKLKKVTKEERETALEKAEAHIRDLMRNDPSISVDKLVSITKFSEYVVKKIYMKLRREHSKKSSIRRKPDGQRDKIVVS